MKTIKIAGVLAGTTLALTSLTGCGGSTAAESPAKQDTAPAVAGQARENVANQTDTEQNAQMHWIARDVKLPDGRTVMCVYGSNHNTTGAGVSCDWTHTGVRK